MKIMENNVSIVENEPNSEIPAVSDAHKEECIKTTGKKNINNVDMVRDEKKIIVHITHLGPDQVKVEPIDEVNSTIMQEGGTAEEAIRQEDKVKIVYSQPDPPVTIE